MIQYSIKKPEEEGGEPLVVKTGHEHEFRLSDAAEQMAALRKNVRQCRAQVELEEAKMNNIAHYHPEVEEMDVEKRCAVALYEQSRAVREQFQKKMGEFQGDIDSIGAELVEINRQTGEDVSAILAAAEPGKAVAE